MDQNSKDAAQPVETKLTPAVNTALPTPAEPTRPRRDIVQLPLATRKINSNIISFKYYNSFNYDLLPKGTDEVRAVLGITSANEGEGKTLVASNLAVSLAMGYQKRTVLVDLNIDHPSLHQVFGAVPAPGLINALHGEAIHVSPTRVPNLSILATGDGHSFKAEMSGGSKRTSTGKLPEYPPMGLGLGHMAAFAEVVYSLQQEYEFVIVDMPAINTGHFPVLFANRLNGLLVVVDTSRTRRGDIEKLFRQISERQVLGFIFNRVTDTEN